MVLPIQCGMREEAKQTQSIVDGYNHGWDAGRPSSRQLASVIIRRGAVDIAAAVNPDHNWEARCHRSVPGAELRCEDVQVKAVFVHARRTCEHTERCHLRADVAEMSGIARFLPFPNRLGRHPTQLAYRRSGVRDSTEFVDTIPDETRNRTLSRVYDGSSLVAGGNASA